MKIRTPIKIIGAIVGLAIVALLALPLFVSADTLKAQLIAQVKKTTGRNLEITGDTSLSVFPNIAVSAEGVTLYNPDGFTSPYLVKMKKLSTGAALRPLLAGNLQVTGITLDGAEVYLEETAGGRKNWEFTAEKIEDAAEKETKKPEAQDASFLKSFALGDIDVTDSKLHYQKGNEKPKVIEDIDITLSGADANAPLKLDGSAAYNQKTIQANVVIEELKAFLADKDSPLKVAIAVPGATVDFDGKARMGETLNAIGKLDADVSSLPSVMEWATGKEPSGSLPKVVLIDGTLSAKDNKYSIADASFKVNDTAAKGKLSVDSNGSVPNIVGALAFGELNLDEWKSADGKGAGSGSDKAEGWSNERIDLSGLKGANASLALTFDAIKSERLVLGPTNADVNLSGGALKIAIDKTSLYGGSANGVIRLSEAGVGADIAASGVKVEPLMEALSGKSRVEGTTALKLNLQGSGNSERAIVNSLNGNGNITIADGAVKGVNLGKFWREAKKGFLFDSSTEKTDFSELSGSFTVANGVASNNDLSLKSPALRVSGKGTANLPARSLNYTLTPTVVATTKGQGGQDDLAGVTVPLLIAGNWSNPSITPDFAHMLKDPASLQQNVKNIGETIKDFNSTDDLKRALLGEPKAETIAPAAGPTTAAPQTAPQAAPTPAPAQESDPIKEGLGNLLNSF